MHEPIIRDHPDKNHTCVTFEWSRKQILSRENEVWLWVDGAWFRTYLSHASPDRKIWRSRARRVCPLGDRPRGSSESLGRPVGPRPNVRASAHTIGYRSGRKPVSNRLRKTDPQGKPDLEAKKPREGGGSGQSFLGVSLCSLLGPLEPRKRQPAIEVGVSRRRQCCALRDRVGVPPTWRPRVGGLGGSVAMGGRGRRLVAVEATGPSRARSQPTDATVGVA